MKGKERRVRHGGAAGVTRLALGAIHRSDQGDWLPIVRSIHPGSSAHFTAAHQAFRSATSEFA
jgi:hypothetical protein